MSLTRRLFVRWSAAASAALAVIPGLRRSVDAQGRAAAAAPPQAAPGLTVSALLPLAYAVLPAELGGARIERAATAFARWIGSYKAGEETLHPYGSDRLGATGASPAAKWAGQLRALDIAARNAHGGPFSEQTLVDRTALVQAALAKEQLGARLPSPISSPHVAVALLAHFTESAEGVNLAYARTIDPKQCRPLAASPNIPIASGRGGRG